MTTATAGIGELESFRRLVSRRLGLSFEDAKLAFLADVLARRAQATGQNPTAYLARLDAEASTDEVSALAQELTVAETYFFRNVEQFRAFAEISLPDRAREAQAAGRPLQILSAGCASGEEPYSLAILVRDVLPGRMPTVPILAIDINPAAIARATRGRYSAWALRETPQDIRQRWFQCEGKEFVLDEAIRGDVTFEICNLVDERVDVWRPESYDIVFCRNLLMYFTPESAQSLISRITRALRPGGYLFLGHAETLRGLSNSFHLQHTHGTFYYQRKERLTTAPVLSARIPAAAPPVAPLDLTALVDDAGTWVDAIRRASERIEMLTVPAAARPSRIVASAPKPVWDVAMVLELLRKERFAEAFELVQSFPAESGRDAEVLLLRAVLLAHSGQLAKAEEACRRLLELDELNAGAHYLLALCGEGRGDVAGAIDHDQVAAYLDPGFAMPRLHRGLIARRLGDRVTAREELGRAITLLQREEPARLLLFGGGFGRDALVTLCRTELVACGGAA